MHRVALCLLLAGCTMPPPESVVQSADCQVRQIGRTYVASARGRLLVRATVDDTPVLMDLDTGADVSVVTPELAQRLGLQVDPLLHPYVHGTGGIQRTTAVKVNTVGFAGRLWVEPRVLVGYPAATGPGRTHGLQGTLGGDVFAGADVELDLPHHSLVLWQVTGCAGDFVPWQQAHYRLPLRRGERTGQLTTVQVNGHDVDAMIDWGTGVSLIGLRAATEIGVQAADMQGDPVRLGAGGDQHINPSRLHRFETLRIGPETLHDVHLDVVDLAPMMPPMILGVDFATARRLWLSPATGQMFVAPER